MDDDQKYMLRALELAKQAWGDTTPNPMVGAVVVNNGKIVGEGFHHKAGEAHAEVNALRAAGSKSMGATIYVTLEPCSSYGRTPPCTEAIIKRNISRVVIGALDPNPKHAGRGIDILRNHNIEVEVINDLKQVRELNRPFFKLIQSGKPWVFLKMAMTLDGKIAAWNGDSKWITGEIARTRVQYLRRRCSAIMVGGNTLRQDHPRLTIHDCDDEARQPLKVIASRHLTAADLEEYFPGGRRPLLCQVDNKAQWNDLLLKLGKMEVDYLMLEGGGELAASALFNQVVDEV
ncbi:MAG: bifunctional diaminohydroxyphosphoribosylaminopyrimidine deaminase/5-amino-6-(5-phosphoribosylamino)uracil reductase RibD, partial [Victivallaceae bacterium]